MAMGRSNRERQTELWIAGDALPRSPGHPFYEKLNAVLDEQAFDAFVERECAQYYAERMGRPGLPPAVYFKLLFIGFFEGLDSELGIALPEASTILPLIVAVYPPVTDTHGVKRWHLFMPLN